MLAHSGGHGGAASAPLRGIGGLGPRLKAYGARLAGSSDCVQTWIGKGDVFCPDAGNDAVEVYKYPAGGSPIANLNGPLDLPIGVVEVTK